MSPTSIFLTFMVLSVCCLRAGSRNSASYTVVADTLDAGGRKASSATYTNDGSTGGISGNSTAAAPAATDKAGYIGQLFEAAGLTLTAPAGSMDEASTMQLGATLTFDDGTTLTLPPASVTWGLASAPVTGISSSGLLTAGVVYQDTAAAAQGSYDGLPAVLDFTVVNTLPDNYGTYAADGLPDLWQVDYFGLHNPAAGPAQDPDGDGYDNLFEYNACLIPTNPLSVFTMSISDVPGGGHAVVFSPRQPGCSYSVEGSSDLSLWDHVTGTITDDGRIRTVEDPAGKGARRFYRVNVQRQ